MIIRTCKWDNISSDSIKYILEMLYFIQLRNEDVMLWKTMVSDSKGLGHKETFM